MIRSDRRATTEVELTVGKDQTVPYGTDSRFERFPGISCLANLHVAPPGLPTPPGLPDRARASDGPLRDLDPASFRTMHLNIFRCERLFIDPRAFYVPVF